MDRMQTVIDRLLFLARAEGGGLRSDLQPIALKDFVAEFTEDATVLLEDAGAKFVVTACDEGLVRADRGLLRQLLLNLVSNAAKVSPPGGVVSLEARAGGVVWLVTVTDEGPGLPADKFDLIFERFTRVESSGGSALRPAGHGLGLAICKSRIHASDRPDGRQGLRVTLELPR
jgi:two-component system heavy metal sensor histidine kinase CusS